MSVLNTPPWIVFLFQVLSSRRAVFQLGAMRIHQFCDGVIDYACAHGFFGVNADDAAFEALSRAHGLDVERFEFPVTVTLVELEGRRILIDAGHGPDCRPSAGQLPLALAEAGIAPSSIDTVIITHLHRDHVGGLLDEQGLPFFAGARHLVRKCECDHWLGPNIDSGADCDIARSAQSVVQALGDRLDYAEPGEVVAPGVTLLDSAGHTPGHMCVGLESGAEKLIVASDLANHPVWSIMRPNWHMSLDWDGPMAAQTRARLLGQMADSGLLMAGYHMPFPAIGRIQRTDDGFCYVPVTAIASSG